MGKADDMQACVASLASLEEARKVLSQMASAHGSQRRRQWVLVGPLPFGDVEFQVRLSFAEVLALVATNKRWTEGKLRGLLGDATQRWASTVLTAKRRPWWRRMLDL